MTDDPSRFSILDPRSLSEEETQSSSLVDCESYLTFQSNNGRTEHEEKETGSVCRPSQVGVVVGPGILYAACLRQLKLQSKPSPCLPQRLGVALQSPRPFLPSSKGVCSSHS